MDFFSVCGILLYILLCGSVLVYFTLKIHTHVKCFELDLNRFFLCISFLKRGDQIVINFFAPYN